MQLSNAYLLAIIKQPIWRVKLRVLQLVKFSTTERSTTSGVTVISVQNANILSSPVNLSSAIVGLNHILRRRSSENARSADAVIFDKVVRT